MHFSFNTNHSQISSKRNTIISWFMVVFAIKKKYLPWEMVRYIFKLGKLSKVNVFLKSLLIVSTLLFVSTL